MSHDATYDALTQAHNALTFAKPMIGSMCADSPSADLRERRNKVYAKVDAALAAVIEAMKSPKPETGWIACSARLPDTMNRTLVADECGRVVEAEWDWNPVDRKRTCRWPRVTHWMPLPSAPMERTAKP